MLAHSFSTVLGPMTAVESDGRVTMLLYSGSPPEGAETGTSPLLIKTETQVREYLSGNRKGFDLPIDGGFEGFSEEVMDAMSRIPYGSTVTYGELAEMSGHPGAARAVGTVCRKNPLPLIYPCHRVVPSSGGIGNYSGAPGAKEYLLKTEGSFTEASVPLRRKQ